MRILFIVVPVSDRHGDDFMHFPVGLSYIASRIRRDFPGAVMKVVDLNFETDCEERTLSGVLAKFKNFNPDYLLFGGMVTRYAFIRDLSRQLKKVFPSASQVVGGSIADTGYAHLVKATPIDIFVIGEGEDTIVDILNGKPLKEIDGIVARMGKSEKPLITQDRKRMKALDETKRPLYEIFQVDKYIESTYRNTGWRYMTIVGSRGCPFSCNFCYRNFGSLMTFRSPALVVEELLFLKERYRIDSFYMLDELQFINRKWIREFAELLIGEKLGLKYTVVSRAALFKPKNRAKDMELLRLAKDSGLLRVTIGIESGNQDILDLMGKQTKVHEIEYTLRLLRDAGIKATGSMLVGYPSETQKTIADSVEFAKRNLLKTSFYCLIPMPGTPLYQECCKQGLIVDEVAYLEKISKHGDASHIYINLTELSDEQYASIVDWANSEVGRVRLKDIFSYYGLLGGVLESVKFYGGSIRSKLTKRVFDTP